MKTRYLRGALVAVALACLAESVFDAHSMARADVVEAQEPQVEPPPAPRVDAPQPEPAAVPPDGVGTVQSPDEAPSDDRGRSVVRFGSDFTLRHGDVVEEAVVIGGSATIDGHVEGDLVVVFGSARLTRTAAVEGDVVVVGGNLTVEPGVTVGGDLVVVGGALDAPETFTPGGEQVAVGALAIGHGLRALGPWVTNGLFWGRPIVPSLPWVWAVWAVFAAVYLALGLIFATPVRAIADHATERPLSAFMVGLLVLLLLGPVMVLLAVSVIGIIVIPFLIGAVFIAALLGRVGVLRATGGMLVPTDRDSALHSARAVMVGVVAISLVYMVPVLGLVTWALVGVLGLGAGSMAFAEALRHENPRTAPPPPAVPPAVPPPIPLGVDDSPLAGAPPEEMPVGVPVSAVSPADLSLRPRATFLDRLGAFTLDVLLALLAFGLLDLNDDGAGRFFLLLLAYRIGFWAWKGTTVGGIICHLRVVRTDGAPLRFGDALVRGLGSIFSFAVVGLGCLFILWDPERQAWHDKIAGTYVVKVPPSTPW